VPRIEYLSGSEKILLAGIRFSLSLAVQEPICQEFQLHMLEAIVVEDLLHPLKASRLQNLIEIGVPYSETCEPGPGRRLNPVVEIERAVFSVGVWDTSGNGPVRGQQINISVHRNDLKSAPERRHVISRKTAILCKGRIGANEKLVTKQLEPAEFSAICDRSRV
jgi:hypothetical protein